MMDVGTKHKKKELKIGMQIDAKERDGLVTLFKAFLRCVCLDIR